METFCVKSSPFQFPQIARSVTEEEEEEKEEENGDSDSDEDDDEEFRKSRVRKTCSI